MWVRPQTQQRVTQRPNALAFGYFFTVLENNMANRRVENLTQERLEELAEREDTIVYAPEHTHLFDAWPAEKVRACVRKIVKVAKNCATAEEACTKLSTDEELRGFAENYQKMWSTLTQPQVAQNQGHVDIMLAMVDLRARVEAGELNDTTAQKMAAEEAMIRLLAQAREQ